MNAESETARAANARAILLITLSMVGFVGVDIFVKLASSAVGPGQILATTSAVIFLTFLAILKLKGERFFTRAALGRAMLVRTAGEVVGSVGIIIALGLVPLSTVTVMGQAMPLVVTVGAALFLGETVGWRRWMAVVVGLVGVLFILRPGFEGFDANVLWVLLYVVGLGARDLASRQLPRSVSTPYAVAWAMGCLTLAGTALIPFEGGWAPMSPLTTVYLFGMVVMASMAITLITVAMRVGEASAVAPFRYTRLIFALVAAYVLFGEVPDALTWLGSGLIVGSGLYAFVRERQRRTAARA